MKRVLFLVSIFFATITMFAASIQEKQAQKVGLNFMTFVTKSAGKSTECQLVYTKMDTQNHQPAFYVFQVGKGFVIVAADDCVKPILGYSTENSFSSENMPENVASFLDDFSKEIQTVKSLRCEAGTENSRQWQTLLSDDVNIQLFTKGTTEVSPLLSTTWSQFPYYNNLCPGGSVTGCTATAMAQIINFWEYPNVGTGTHTYTHNTYGTLTADFSSTTYQYSLMPNQLTASSSSAQINAVATLMYHCGVAANMNYSPSSSSAYLQAARSAFINHFGYNPNVGFADKDLYTSTAWISLLKSDLNAGRPICYIGYGDAGGHAFVCDGFNTNDYFHFNWGWDGNYDGYFVVSNLNPENYTFNSDQSALFNLFPAANQNKYVFNIEGITTEVVSNTTLIAHPYGFGSHSGYTYLNTINSQMILYPENSGDQLSLQVLSYQEQNVVVYDGVGISGNLLLSSISNNPPPVTSTTGALTLVYSGSFNYSGFQLQVSIVPVSGCYPPTNLTATTAGTNINLVWNAPSNYLYFKVYRGTTEIATVNTTTYTDANLSQGNYCYTVKTVCENGLSNPSNTACAEICQDIYTNFSVTTCDSYIWNSQTYTTSGDYVQTFDASNGCDSVVSLHLTVNPSYETAIAEAICFGESFDFFGETLTESGVYEHTLQSVGNCDSLIVLTLTVNALPDVQIEGVTEITIGESVTLTASGASTYLWSTGETTAEITVIPSDPTTYSVVGTNENGCENAAEHTVNVNNVDISEVDAAMFKIFPNPTNGLVNIEGEKISRIEMYNSVGQFVTSRKIDEKSVSSFQLNIQQYESGTYLIRIVTQDGKAVMKRLVVAH